MRSLGREPLSRSTRFLALRRLARSGAAVITTSSAFSTTCFAQAVHRCGTSTTTQGTFSRTTSSTVSQVEALKIVGAVERDGRGEQAQVIRAARQQPVEEHLVEALGRRQGIGDALHRILVEIEAGGAEGRSRSAMTTSLFSADGHGEGDVVADGARADAALGADEGDDLADRVRLRVGVDGWRCSR